MSQNSQGAFTWAVSSQHGNGWALHQGLFSLDYMCIYYTKIEQKYDSAKRLSYIIVWEWARISLSWKAACLFCFHGCRASLLNFFPQLVLLIAGSKMCLLATQKRKSSTLSICDGWNHSDKIKTDWENGPKHRPAFFVFKWIFSWS